ncbi:hypothetical protein NOR51B_657 [Luminiphilus syltensis NOR5-1B]|uniref:SnoaL-like domain-containing protein n=1 Tax=Luminiphilus syltensis NOR5-1B TaxID=565045 RepID=B8KYK9_9GAMM|nr:nuclear transport factor 2 family protein [Luminiphilus syltensis]EED34718.1 hypothetical protein NOR51B_657 [Luminiphilus syltensis NOR5-1B]
MTNCDLKAGLKTVKKSLALTCVFALLPLTSNMVKAVDLETKSKIIDLMVCYARATDTFGELGNTNAYHEALAIYKKCFSEEASFNFWPVGSDFDGPPSQSIVTPDAWAKFVDSVIPRNEEGQSISRGHHMLSNYFVELDGDEGKLEAYLSATRVNYSYTTGSSVTDVTESKGFYTLSVKKTEESWLVTRLELRVISVSSLAR